MSDENVRPFTFDKFTAPGDIAGMKNAEGGTEGHVEIPAWQGDDEVVDLSVPLDDDDPFTPPARSVEFPTLKVDQVDSVVDRGPTDGPPFADAKIVDEHLGMQGLRHSASRSDAVDEIQGNRRERIADDRADSQVDLSTPYLVRTGADPRLLADDAADGGEEFDDTTGARRSHRSPHADEPTVKNEISIETLEAVDEFQAIPDLDANPEAQSLKEIFITSLTDMDADPGAQSLKEVFITSFTDSTDAADALSTNEVLPEDV